MESTTTQSSESKILSSLVGGFIFLFIYGLIVLLFHPHMVSGGSMIPTYESGDIVSCKPLDNESNLSHGDICVVNFEDILCIKRLIAMPGDDVYICNGQIFVNNAISPYIFDEIEDAGIIPIYTNDTDSLHLSENEYLFIGDNRNHSTDGRVYGLTKIENIKYIVIKKIL